MLKSDKTPKWLIWLMAPYFMVNIVLGGFSAIMPIIVGPGYGFNALQIKLIFVSSYLLKAVAMLLMQKSTVLGLALLLVGCLIGTWLAWPFFWGNLNTKMLLFDWGILAILGYNHLFWKQKN